MVKLDKIYTRGGDKGNTSLSDGSRVEKSNPRIKAIGSVDETNSTVGLARLYSENFSDIILPIIQNDLFDLGADLSKPEKNKKIDDIRVTILQVQRLENEIDKINKTLSDLKSFVLPSGTSLACHLHLARTVARRAERDIMALSMIEEVNPLLQSYINRLSDLLFVLARRANFKNEHEFLWKPNLYSK